MYERETNKIDSSLCIRCEEEIETWDHVWLCSNNELGINVIIKSLIEIEKEYKECNNMDKWELCKKINADFVAICNEPSRIIINRSKSWEIVREVFNNKFNNFTSNQEIRNIVKEI